MNDQEKDSTESRAIVIGPPAYLPPQVKYVQYSVQDHVCVSGGNVRLLQGPIEGFTASTRIGKTIRYLQMECIGYFFMSGTKLYDLASIRLVYDRMPRSSIPPSSDIVTAFNECAMPHLENSERFEILYTHHQTLVGALGTGGTPNCFSATSCALGNFTLDLEGRLGIFKNASNSMTSYSQGSLYVHMIGSGPAAPNATTFRATFRLRYVDV